MGDRYLTHLEIRKTIKKIEKLKIPLTVFEVLTLVFIINAAKRNNDFVIMEAGCGWRLDSNNVIDFPLIQSVVNINKQHLRLLKVKTLNDVINEKVGFLNNFTNIYVGKQKPFVIKRIRKLLKKNTSKTKYSNTWRLVKNKKKYFYENKNIRIKIDTKYIHSKGLLENLCLAIRIALDLKIDKQVIERTIPNIKLPGRIDYLTKGKIVKKVNRNEKILIDGCHSETSAKNLATYLKTTKVPIYGVWGMTKNKDPNKFIKQFKGVFKKIITIPIENDSASLSNKFLYRIAKKNNFNTESSRNIEEALKKITSRDKKIICFFGSLYLCGNILNKN